MEQLELIGGSERSLTSSRKMGAVCGDVSAHSLGEPLKPRAREAWALEPHICRHCMGGRLVSQTLEGGGRRYQCTNCGAQVDGAGPAALCCCGIRVRRHGPAGGFTDPGVRCHENPDPSPEFPSLIVASERPPATKTDS